MFILCILSVTYVALSLSFSEAGGKDGGCVFLRPLVRVTPYRMIRLSIQLFPPLCSYSLLVCCCIRCGPCRQFTPVLSSVYQAVKAGKHADKFEVVFCSADHAEPEFKSYFQSMAPWLAIDYEVSGCSTCVMYYHVLSYSK